MSTWMVVEDEPDIYEVLLAMFEMWGIEGVAFVDGEEAVAWIDDVDNGRFKGELPELALLDIRLPGDINGIEVGRRLRESPILGKIAIVLTTGYQMEAENKEEAMVVTKADLWLPKPLPKFNELQGTLESVIAKRRQQNAQAIFVTEPEPDNDDTETIPSRTAAMKASTSKSFKKTDKLRRPSSEESSATADTANLPSESDTPVSNS
ncbi:MAG: response regulator [Anaerolineae bacterium]|nr:response regulator [Anaerolineae bacterium]MCB9459292.1 response regulator [Anaerolineaceae bacterium]